MSNRSGLKITFNDFTRAMFLSEYMARRRNVNKACRYPEPPYEANFLRELYDFNAAATRACEVRAGEMWKSFPDLYETPRDNKTTPFERGWKALIADPMLGLKAAVRTWDILAGICRYGVMLLGLSRGKLEEPAAMIDPNDRGKLIRPDMPQELRFVRTFDENSVMIQELDLDTNSTRYGQPLFYTLKLPNVQPGTGATDSLDTSTTIDTQVHWSRVLHLAHNTKESPIYGTSELANIVPFCLDIQRIAGASAEGYWKAAFAGISFETMPELLSQGLTPKMDEKSLKKNVDRYMDEFERFIAVDGMKANQLKPEIMEPSKFVELPLMMISVAKSVPYRILVGSEAGHLASQQDKLNWNDQISALRETHGLPKCALPLANRLIDVGVLPKPRRILTEWNDPNTTTDTERANVALKRVQAMSQFCGSNARFLMTRKSVLVNEFGYSSDKADAIIAEVDAAKDFVPVPAEVPGAAKPVGGNKSGKRATGADANRPAKM